MLQVNVSDSEAEEGEGLDAAAQFPHRRSVRRIMPLVRMGVSFQTLSSCVCKTSKPNTMHDTGLSQQRTVQHQFKTVRNKPGYSLAAQMQMSFREVYSRQREHCKYIRPVFKGLFSPTKCSQEPAHTLMFAGSRWWFCCGSFPGATGSLLLQMLVHTQNLTGSMDGMS